MPKRPTVPAHLTLHPFTLEEARRAGLTLRQLQGRSWRRLGEATYVWAGLPPSPTLTLAAAARCLPPTGVFSGRTAAFLHGLDVPPDDPIEVIVQPTFGSSARLGMAVRRAVLDPDEVTIRKGMRVTSMARTLVDLARQLPLVEAVVVTDAALHARLVTAAGIDDWIARHPRRWGTARIRRVADLADSGAESPMETRLRLLIVQAGLPRPATQFGIRDGDGQPIARADLCYPVERLCIEFDGGTHRMSLVADNRRQNRLLNAGYKVLRYTGADVLGSPEVIVAQVRDALSASGEVFLQAGARLAAS